jgi:hypothetical protein
MSGNQKQAIDELAQVLDKAKEDALATIGSLNRGWGTWYAEAVHNAGYRKQSVVIDEFAKRLKEKMNDLSRMEYNCVPYFLVSKSFIDKIAAEMKGGAE